MNTFTGTGQAPSGPSSQDANHPPSAEPETLEVQNKELRRKVSEMGEANKDLSAQLDMLKANQMRIEQQLASAPAPEAPTGPSLGDLTAQVLSDENTPEQAAQALQQAIEFAIEKGDERATTRFEQKYGSQLQQNRQDNLRTAAQKYFEDSPELAEDGSRFWAHIKANMTPTMGVALGNGDHDSFLTLGMQSYVAKYGQPATNDVSLQARQERQNASLARGTQVPTELPSEVAKALDSLDASDPNFMQKMSNIIEETGATPEQIEQLTK